MPETALTVAAGEAYGKGVLAANLGSVDASNGNTFPNDGSTILVVAKGGTGGVTVTFRCPPGPRTLGRQIEKQFTVAQDALAILGPFPPEVFGSDVVVHWSTATAVTARPVRLARTPI